MRIIGKELTQRWGDPFWKDMDPRLDKLNNKMRDLTREQGGGRWEKVPKNIREALEMKKDELMMAINQHREELKEEKAKSGKGDIKDIERI